jgi:tetratricopeptide (TPR) repeat protein/predicted Ser/Thr protein kinase
VGLRTGSTVLHYRIERRLGAGGMGEVYLAHDTKLHRQVAIKFLSAPDDAHARRRLLREARAAAGLDHPGVCAVYEVGTDPARGDFVVMQYVEGEALSDRLRRGRLEPTEALQVAERIAEALMAAHDRGIVHRDLKPQNVIIMPSGRPKLLDFGLAKRALTGAAAAEAQTTAAITRPYAMLGTPGYMAPEQIRNGPVDRRADVFALGCVLYECLTGQRAFPGPTPPDMLGQVLHTDPPPVSSVVPGIGEGVDALCARLLRKDVKERCQSAEEALGAIRALLPPGTPVSETGRRSSRASSIQWRPENWRLAAGLAMAIVIVVGAAIGVVEWRHRHRVPAPSADAQKWFDRGVAAIREGAYAGARASFEEAVRLDPQYAQAYARLAEARSELDDEKGAQAALLHVNELVPDRSDLGVDERIRLEAVSATVLHEHDQAIDAYRQLADERPKDASEWLDLGRAEEAAGKLADARATYAKALDLDGQYAAAFLRLGSVPGEPTAAAIGQLDQAIRLYGIAADIEGQAEGLLREGVLLSTVGRYGPAREALDQVVSLTADERYASQRLRARFELARVTAYGGQLTQAEALGRAAVDEATAAGWQGLAANGLVDLANALMLANQNDRADTLLVRAISLAVGQGATRTEMRARLQQASLREATGHPDEAIALTAAPLRFFSAGHYARFEATADSILSRANEDLEHYDDASRQATAVLHVAESMGDDTLVATSLENLAGQLTSLGRLPEALADRERMERIHRTQKDLVSLPYDLTNRAELLIRLGRGPEAEAALDEVDRAIASGLESYRAYRATVALLRALRASVDRRFKDVVALVPSAATASTGPATSTGATGSGRPTSSEEDTALFARVLAEHARAELGQSRVPVAALSHWPEETSSPVLRRELAYWVADTLVARGDEGQAAIVAAPALSAVGGQDNLEWRWRLEAAVSRGRHDAVAADGATMASHASADLQRLSDLWRGAATAYLARPDLVELRRSLQ